MMTDPHPMDGKQEPVAAPRARRHGWLMPLARIWRDKEGAGAVEFAILAPILLVLYICAFELTIGLSVAKRATRASGTVADLVTQQTSVTKAYLATMVDVSKAIFVPYGTTGLKLKISGVKIDSAKAAKVVWSWAQDGTKPYAVNTAVTVPADMLKADSFLVHTELSIPHELMMFMANSMATPTTTVNISREYFFRQRVGDTVPCGDC